MISDSCTIFTDIYNAYIEKGISSISLILNILCSMAFMQIIRCNSSANKNGQDIFKYLFYKSLMDICISLRFALKSIFNCKDCSLEKIYAIKVFYLIFLIYVDTACELLTMLCQVMACFNRYRFVTNKWNILDKLISYKLVLASITLFSLLFYIYLFFDRQIITKIRVDQNETLTLYLIQEESLGIGSQILNYAHSLTRNVFCVVFIFVFNVLTFCSVKKSLDKKKLMFKSSTSSSSQKLLSKSEKAELRLTLMVISTNLVILVTYGMSFIRWMKIKEIDQITCFATCNYIIYQMSFSLNFFIYFYFNKSFKVSLSCFRR
jgi:hypothetical protein